MERLAEVKLNNSQRGIDQYAVIEIGHENGMYKLEFLNNVEVGGDSSFREYSRQNIEADENIDIEDYVAGPADSAGLENPEIVLREKPGTKGERVSELSFEDDGPSSFSLPAEIQYSHAYDNFEDYLSDRGIDPGHAGFIDWASGLEQDVRHNLLQYQDINELFEPNNRFGKDIGEYERKLDLGTFNEIRGRKVKLVPEDDFRFDGNESPNFLDQAGLRFHNGILTQKPEEIRKLLGGKDVYQRR